jgi:hypothetical protein
MRFRIGLGVGCVVLLGASPGAATATHSNGAGPNADLAVGTAEVVLPPPFGPSRLHIDRPPTASSPQFYDLRITVLNPNPAAVHGDLLCLEAAGNTAVFRAVVTRSNDPLVPEGSGIDGQIEDNGEGSSRTDEATAVLTPPPTGPADCPPPLATSRVEQGNYVVHDSGR